MAPRSTFPLSPPLSPLPPLLPLLPPSLLARLRASTWAPVALRVGAVAIALLVLAWIGRAAAAGPTAGSSIAAAGPDRDAEAGDAGNPLALPVATAPPAAAPPPATASRTQASATEPVFLNHAGVDELRRLPGVGPKRAEAILVLRQRLGRFQRVEDLLRVKGVGRAAVKKWRPLVRLDTPSAESSADAGGRQ
jgi:competence protein ComEA